MPKKRKPEPWEVTKEDIEREVQRMRDNASKYPSLRLIVDKYPEGYDPDRQPETKSQIKLKRRVDKVTSDPRGQIYVVDVPTGVGADLHMIDGSLILDMPAVNPAQVGFARFVDIVHDAGFKIIDNAPDGYQIDLGHDTESAFHLCIAAIRAQGALATELDVS